ncbi:DUF4919 domain-containing protein [Coprobacter sp.]
MKNKIIILFFSLFLLIPVSKAEDKDFKIPDLKEIKKNIRDYNSHLYYPYLIKRFLNNDTTFTLKELRHLYLGYSYQEGYNPYRVNKHPEEIMKLYAQPSHTEAECDTIINYATQLLNNFPFDLRQMHLLAYAYNTKGEKDKARIWTTKMRQMLEAIRSTGDGKSPETAWFVINSTHEYDIINSIGYKADKYIFVEPAYDFIEISENPDKTEGFYFNVSRMLKEYERKYKEN